MENYILSLIKENNRVIIPNFGAFIVAKENGFSVLFNNFLSFNDGLLVDHLVEMENITKEEAEEKIDAYVEKVKSSLDENGKYEIAGLGTFTKDATGILRFEQVETLTSEEDVKTEPLSPVAESDELLDIDNATEAEKEEEITEASTELPDTSLNDTTPIAEVEEEQPSSYGSKIEPETGFDKDTAEEEKKDPVVVANKYIEEDNSKRNRSIAIFLAAFILLPLIGFSIYFFFLKDNSPAKTQKKIKTEIAKVEPKPIPASDAAGTIDAGPVDTAANETKAEPVEEVQPVAKPEVSKPHQLIVGSFSTEANANKMIEKLKSKGHDQCFWFMHNNRYLVSLESFAKVYEAQARQEEILQSDRMESWIITKRQ
ncbi:HU family DNA-binding protein [Carboxylicivirga mesophila]|uniref:HU family DNA-binding protein n=1 Tax=Carboxylicivirga mesophila TaxID=1166478 RepID=A0ABS5KFV8_9BACT|nr:HU family DNA-binding protein [Carboxylicivirga mesophila]MBS2213906.1 HU family DNA-binding protein [Carboxylicivirga mesophila]